MCFGMTARDNQIADVRNPGEGVGENKNGVALAQPIRQQQERTDQAQPPKAGGDHNFLVFFSGKPLDKKAGKEDHVAGPADDFPKAPFDAEKLVVVKN